ncbi:uncharacterized protein LACBIDRAFT_292726 [Laccaria bicolor S238N-H82]|uniref:Predicted protein n=1 Tax=Laccaria bicolor (strain S238N-H82 / ATCC MYA-4686) TaxID=486041 RepID=B0CZY2_LACBS|nr:uncharacterized protein LACBIDRAFT_292726 [Laccaria bicolor S238N-H82]EDR12231.1 predicted protein [Laccaria bicolor S238N-H82]|eukprot:XP_001876495.1 predicted protein [Laccaria bicolor S238N-H82]
MWRRYNRSASLAITSFGAVTNLAITIHVLIAWRSLKWEPESEWESSGGNWRLDGVKILWALLFIYFTSAATVCIVGLLGIVKVSSPSFLLLPHIPSYVRFYRDYSIADFSFCAFSAALATYGAFNSTARAGVCEEFSHHPELMRDMLEMGLTLENCERWLERAVLAALAVLFIVMVIRVRHTLSYPFLPLILYYQLHFLLAVSNFYSHLMRHHHARTSSRSISCSAGSLPASTTQRIFLLPQQHETQEPSSEVVYAPVPLNSLPKEMQMQAMEAWVQQQPEDGQGSERPRHHHHHHHSHSHHHHHRRQSRSSSADTLTGTIRLDIKPDEGLLPAYDGEDVERGKA